MKLYLTIGVLLLVSLVGGIYRVKTSGLASEDANVPSVQTDRHSLSTFTAKLWDTCKAQSSEARKTILINQLVRIAEQAFTSRAEQESFLLMVCIESKFNPQARSSAGAIGLTQVIPKFAKEFYGEEVSEKDLYDAEVNLLVGAKRFKQLLDQFEGNVALALSGYNSGATSETTKALGKLQTGHSETMGYVARFYTLKEEMK